MRLLRSDGSGEIAGGMVNRLTTNYTYFMRESVHFSILTDKVFPELFGKKVRDLPDMVRRMCHR